MWNRAILAAVVVAASCAASAAQETPGAPANQPTSARTQSSNPVGLKVQVVISRYQGEKKIGSLPYTIGVVANGSKTSLRMGVDVPVISTVFGSASKDGTTAPIPQASYNYRSVGTNIDCQADDAGGGYYKLQMTVQDSSVQLEPAERPKPVMPNVPMFRSFNSSFQVLLRDGQTTQYTSATDPVNGEVTKIDVTLNVLK
jgi:hypothetical protein